MTESPAVLIGESFVGDGAEDAGLVYANNWAVTKAAMHAAARSLPDLTEVLAARAEPSNPFYRPT